MTESIRAQLDQVLKDIEKAKQNQDQNKQKLAELEARRKKLEEELRKLDSGVTQYAARYDRLKEEKEALEKRRGAIVTSEVEKRLRAFEKRVSEIVKEFADDLTALETAETSAAQKQRDAEAARDEALGKLKEAEKRLALWVGLVQTVEGIEKQLGKTLDALALDVKVGRDALAAYRLWYAQSVDASGTRPTSYQEVYKQLVKFLVKPESLEAKIEEQLRIVADAQLKSADAEAALKEATADFEAARKVRKEALARHDREIEQRLTSLGGQWGDPSAHEPSQEPVAAAGSPERKEN